MPVITIFFTIYHFILFYPLSIFFVATSDNSIVYGPETNESFSGKQFGFHDQTGKKMATHCLLERTLICDWRKTDL